MHETIEQFYRYVRPIWARKWVALNCAFVTCLLGWTAVALLPNQYRVRATIQVERSSMLQPLLKGITVETDIASEMAGIMRQTMLVPQNLESIAREAGLVDAAATPEKLDRLVTRLETDIQILSDKEKKGLYTVTYQYSDPHIAQRIVEVLISRFLDSVIATIRADSESTRQIIDQQIAEYHNALEKAALKVKEFKQKHIDLVSEDGRTYYARLQEAKNNYNEAMLQLHEAEQEVYAIRDQPSPSAYASLGTGKDAPIDPLDAQLRESEKALAELQLRLTDEHPDVIATKRTIEQLKEKKDRSRSRKGDRLSGASEEDSLLANPAYQTWKALLTRAEGKVAALRSRVAEYRHRLDELQQGISTMPQLEAELANLNREYIIQEDSYQKLVARRESATISEKVEKASDLKINMLEPPREPTRPVGPNRLRLNAVVLFAGMSVGIGIAWLLSMVSPTIYTRHELREITDLPILGNVSINASLIKPEPLRPYFAAIGALVGIFLVLEIMYLKRVSFLTDLAGSLTKHFSFLS